MSGKLELKAIHGEVVYVNGLDLLNMGTMTKKKRGTFLKWGVFLEFPYIYNKSIGDNSEIFLLFIIFHSHQDRTNMGPNVR